MNLGSMFRRPRTRLASVGLALALSASLANAQVGAAKVEQLLTDRGTPIWSFPDDGGDRFVLMILVGSGARDESRSRAGIAHFLEHVVFTSTKSASKQDLDRALDEHGAEINGSTEHEYTEFHISSSAGDWRFAVDWLAQHLTQPAFLPADVESERRIVTEELDLNNPHAGSVTYEELLYPEQPLGRSIGGDELTVGAVSLAELQSFYAEHYRAANIAVGFAGRVPRVECAEAIRSALASLPAGEVVRPESPVHPKTGTMIYGADEQDASGNLTLGYHLPPAGARDLALQLAIGAYLEGRFSDEVREARQMSYAPEVELVHYTDTHRLQFGTHVSDQNNLPAVVAVCDALIEELRQPDAARVRRVSSQLGGVFDANSAIHLVKSTELAWLAHRSGESPQALLDALEHVDAAEVAAYAARNLTPAHRFLISDSVMLGAGPNAWLMLGLALLVLAVIDGVRGFVWARAVGERWATWRRRRARPVPKRPKKAAASKIEPIDADELEASIQRFFEDQDRKRKG
jgi:predicted Zn-dependent peptidase